MHRVLPLLLILLVGSTAGAADKKKARAHARAANRLFKAEQYEEALVRFEKAYAAYPVPALLYNMGQCHMLQGQYEAAIDRFEKFLRDDPDTRYRADVEKLIAESRRELAARAPPPPPPPAPEPVVETPPVTEPPALPAPVPPPPPPPALAPPAETEVGSTPIHHTWWFWTVVGVVAAGAATGVYFATRTETTTVLPMGDLGVIDRRSP